MRIVIDTTEPLNGTDRAILAAIVGTIPHPEIPATERADAPHSSPEPSTGPAHLPAPAGPVQRHQSHAPAAPGARPAFNLANPIPAYSARQQIANQPGVTITPTAGMTEPEAASEAARRAAGDDGTSSDAGPVRPDETQPAS